MLGQASDVLRLGNMEHGFCSLKGFRWNTEVPNFSVKRDYDRACMNRCRVSIRVLAHQRHDSDFPPRVPHDSELHAAQGGVYHTFSETRKSIDNASQSSPTGPRPSIYPYLLPPHLVDPAIQPLLPVFREHCLEEQTASIKAHEHKAVCQNLCTAINVKGEIGYTRQLNMGSRLRFIKTKSSAKICA